MDHHGSRLSRGGFVVGVGTAGAGLLVGCARLPGQAETTRIRRIGMLSSGNTLGPSRGDFLEELRARGYADGQHVTIEYRFAEGQMERLPALALELVRLPVDVIVAYNTPAALAAQQATATIPIVFVSISDPVGQGLVTSLARPGANLTGLSDFGVTISTKRLELLKDTVPGTSRVAVLRTLGSPATALELSAAEDAARLLGVELHVLEIRGADELPGAFDAAKGVRADAVLLLLDPLGVLFLPQVVTLAASNKLPTMHWNRRHVADGGLMAYGPRYTDLYRRAAYYVDRILKGTKPADLPVEQPMTFDFAVNLKTAAVLGITFPNEIMLQVTEVIQ